jgi:hypothetical protein
MTGMPSPALILVTVRDAEGREVHRTNVTAFVGTGTYDEMCATLRSKLGPGQVLDSADADARHRQLVEAHRLWDAAYQEWFAAGAPTGGHPGGLEEYVDA